jgi:uncharacterized protein
VALTPSIAHDLDRCQRAVTTGAPERDVVERRAAERRFTVEVGGRTAELTYDLKGDHLVLVHTGVPGEIERHGIGGRLVEAAIEWAATQGLTVVPLCPFARWWLRANPDVAAKVTIDWSMRTR